MKDDDILEVLQSGSFKEEFLKIVHADTWDKGLPKFYMDENGWLVEHWQNGTINKLKNLKME
jgi:hypothetical protein